MSKTYDDYKKLAAQASEQARTKGPTNVDPGLMKAKADAAIAYRQEQRSAAAQGKRIVKGQPGKWRDSNGNLTIETAPTKKSLQEEYVRKLSDQPQPRNERNPGGLSPQAQARQRLKLK